MGRLPKKESLIPLAPMRYIGSLSEKEQHCAAWHVLSGCRQVESYVMFVHPDFLLTSAIALKMSKEFFGSAEVIDFMSRYKSLIEEITTPSSGNVDEEIKKEPPKPKTNVTISRTKKSGETDEEFKTRRKREAAQMVIERIIDRADEISDMDDLLNTINAMTETGFFDGDTVDERPPIRYLPESCGTCEYKKFIDEQVRLRNIVQL